MPVTYTPIVTTTLTSNGNITFTSIPSTYTDLVIVGNLRTTNPSASDVVFMDFTYGGTAYSSTWLTGNGSSAASARDTNAAGMNTNVQIPAASAPSETFGTFISHIMNYSNTTTFKTALNRGSSAGVLVTASVGTRRNTAAINVITVAGGNAVLAVGSTLTLYGIKAA
jgi:hypothetical protein